MGKSKRGLTFSVRYRDGLGIKSKLVVGSKKRRPKNFVQGKVLRCEKVSEHELLHCGEYDTIAAKLMKEFSKNGHKEAVRDFVKV